VLECYVLDSLRPLVLEYYSALVLHSVLDCRVCEYLSA
jgi:hypothetical protein